MSWMEDRLRAGLRGVAEQTEVSPAAWRENRERLRRRRVRRAIAPAVAAAVVAVIAVVSVVIVPDLVREDDPAPATEADRYFIALAAVGDVEVYKDTTLEREVAVVYDARTGRHVSRVPAVPELEPPPVDDWAHYVAGQGYAAVAPGPTEGIYFLATHGNGCAFQVARIRIDAHGKASVLEVLGPFSGSGGDLAVSPDGTRLAYVEGSALNLENGCDEPNINRRPRLVVADLASGDTLSVWTSSSQQRLSIEGLAWWNARSLVVRDATYGLREIDTTEPVGDLPDAPKWGKGEQHYPGIGTLRLWHLGVSPEGGLLARFDAGSGDSLLSGIAEVIPETGQVSSIVVRLPSQGRELVANFAVNAAGGLLVQTTAGRVGRVENGAIRWLPHNQPRGMSLTGGIAW